MPSHSGAGTGAVRVGMIGAGPLARMTHQAALDLGIDLYVLADSAADPAVLAGAAHLIGSPDSLDIVTAFADRCHVLTVARDRVPTTHLQTLQAAGCTVRPRAEAVAFAQDPTASRQLLELAGFTLAPHHDGRRPRPHIDAADRNERCDASRLGPIASCASTPVGAHGRGSAELELLVARNPSGHTVNYPVVQVRRAHDGGLEMLMPAPIPEQSAHAALRLAKSIADGIDATGILAVRLALTNDGNLLVRRLATRPHQSGCVTVHTTATSQFHNHLRGILDWPLGSTHMLAPAAATVTVTAPVDGSDPRRRLRAALTVPDAHVHLYNANPTPRRALGHVTALGADHRDALTTARAVADILSGR